MGIAILNIRQYWLKWA